MNIEEFKMMSQQDQRSYVTWEDDGEKFLKYLDGEYMTGTDWVTLIFSKPQLAKYCAWDKLKFADWKRLFSFNDKFADKCPFESFDHIETEELLRLHPELTPYSGIVEPQVIYILNDFPIQPEHDENTPVPFKSLPRLEDMPQTVILCAILQYFGYGVVDAIRKKDEILKSKKTFVAISEGFLTEFLLEHVSQSIRDAKLPIKCISEPFNEEIFRKAE